MARDVLHAWLRVDIELAVTKQFENTRHKKTKAKIVLSMLQTRKSFGNDSKTVIENFATNSVLEIFYAWKLQKVIDTGTLGGFNYEVIDSIYKVIEKMGGHYK
jgi:hypothetical protein